MKLRLEHLMRRSIWYDYLAIALVVMLPLLKLGYVQTVDMVWGPRMPLPEVSSNFYLFYLVIHILSYVLSSMVVQKLILVGVFLLAGVGAHKLSLLAPRIKAVPQAAYMAGMLYMFNPFVYTRLMQGQWLVLVGYALLPWAVGSFWQLQLRPSWAQAWRASGWTIAIGLSSIHAVSFVLFLHLLLFVARGRVELKKRTLMIAGAFGAWVVANSLWVVPILFGHSQTKEAIDSFGAGQLHAFRTVGDVAGSVPLSSLLLEGFWADPQGRYYLPSHLGAWWFIVVILLGALVVSGAYIVIKKRDRLGLVLLAGGLVAWWLAMGVGSSWSAGTTNFLIDHLPFYRGYREPQKWLMVVALLYSYLAALSVAQLLPLIKKAEWRQPSLSLSLLLPVLFTPLLLWGGAGQLVSAQYPPDWATAEQMLNADDSPYKVLLLPWHEYLPISFAKRNIGNPADHYFKQPLVISDNPELAGVPPTEATPLYKLLDNQLLPERNFRTDAAAQLQPYHVKYVLLLKEADWQSYGWVAKQTGFQLIQNSQTLQLYKVNQ